MILRNLCSPEDITQAFEAFLELRPSLPNVQSFVKQVVDQKKEGYEILAILEDDEVVACIGFRMMTTLCWGKIIYIDDLVTKEKNRGRGYGKILLDHVAKLAKEKGCNQLHLDSGYTRNTAHKLYLNQGFELHCHHLALKLK